MTKDELRELIADAVKEATDIDDKTHLVHHEFIKSFMAKEERKREMWDTIKTQVGGWTIIIILGFVGKTVWYFFKEQIK